MGICISQRQYRAKALSPLGRPGPFPTHTSERRKDLLLRYRSSGAGKENFLSLGPYPDITLTEARRRAATARDLVREGTDPVEQRRADVAAPKAQCRWRLPSHRQCVA